MKNVKVVQRNFLFVHRYFYFYSVLCNTIIIPLYHRNISGDQTSVFCPPGQFKYCSREFMDDFNLACSFYVVYLIMIIQGVGTLLPWNMFITAHAVSTQ